LGAMGWGLRVPGLGQVLAFLLHDTSPCLPRLPFVFFSPQAGALNAFAYGCNARSLSPYREALRSLRRRWAALPPLWPTRPPAGITHSFSTRGGGTLFRIPGVRTLFRARGGSAGSMGREHASLGQHLDSLFGVGDAEIISNGPLQAPPSPSHQPHGSQAPPAHTRSFRRASARPAAGDATGGYALGRRATSGSATAASAAAVPLLAAVPQIPPGGASDGAEPGARGSSADGLMPLHALRPPNTGRVLTAGRNTS
jgi:hypothetical protein